MIEGLLPPRPVARPSSTSMSLSLTPSTRAASTTIWLAHVVPGHQRGGAGIDRLAAGERAHSLRDRSGVARGHDDILHAAADPVGHDLRQGRARALSLRCGAGRDRDLAVGEDAHGHTLERPEPRPLHVIADADAEIAPFGARAALARAKAPVVRECERPASGSSENLRSHRRAACRHERASPTE